MFRSLAAMLDVRHRASRSLARSIAVVSLTRSSRSIRTREQEKLSKEDVTELLRKCQCPLTGRVPFEKFQSLLVYNAPRLRRT